jgi:hypothetical protein
MTLTERKTPRLVENIDWKLMGRADGDNFDVINGNGIDRSSHTRCGFDDGGDGGGILRKGIAKLVEFSLLCHPDPSRAAHRIFQFSLSLNQPQRFM